MVNDPPQNYKDIVEAKITYVSNTKFTRFDIHGIGDKYLKYLLRDNQKETVRLTEEMIKSLFQLFSEGEAYFLTVRSCKKIELGKPICENEKRDSIRLTI